MALKAIVRPDDHALLNDEGKIKAEWLLFFRNLEKKPGGSIADLEEDATIADLVAAMNALLVISRNNKFMDKAKAEE